MKAFFPLILLGLMTACVAEKDSDSKQVQQFSTELTQLQQYFQIPGLAVAVLKEGQPILKDFLGYADLENQLPVGPETVFPIASITKVFSAVLIMKLKEEGKLMLDQPIKQFFPDRPIEDSIKVKHVLSHTSQGEIGKHFYYSSRFGSLTKVVEESAGLSFAQYMEESIFQPLQMNGSLLMKDSSYVAAQNVRLAQPYMLDEGVQKGFVDYGFSTSAGIASTLDDMIIFDKALDQNLLISRASKEEMFRPFREDLPYGYGIFSQKFRANSLYWAYGQYDCYSSLLLKIPSQKLSLILMANNNLMSDPARLIYGDVLASLFVLSFLKNMVLGLEEAPILEDNSAPDQPMVDSLFFRKKLLAQALSESFMARYEVSRLEKSATLLEKTFQLFPNYLAYADLNLLHTLSFLKDVSFYRNLGEFDRFDGKIEAIGAKLLKEDPQNPYTNIYLATYYGRKGQIAKAKTYYRRVAEADNFTTNWYTREARLWLNQQELALPKK